MDIINQSMIYLLTLLKGVTGSYGLAIIAVTVLIRVLLWPLNTAQARSMKKMQELQPKLKQLQERYKDNPQKLQEAMMKFYGENKFNPFSGCLPLLVQIPIFIGLYGALNSPEFLAKAGNESFLFIDKLHNTLQSYAGPVMDKQFNVKANDHFQTGKVATIYFKNSANTVLQPVQDPGKALTVHPTPLIPGETITLDLGLGLSSDYLNRVDRVEVPVINANTKELEELRFLPKGDTLTTDVPTVLGKTAIHYDVLILIAVYGALTILYQQLMQKGMAQPAEAGQAQMMKFMPLMFVGMLFFIPIPAGVMVYLVITTALMYIQTWWVNRTTPTNGEPPSERVIDVQPEQA